MTSLQSCLIDVLKPEKGVFHYYETFLSRYSLITVSTIVPQLSLMPETYEGMTKDRLDSDIDTMISGLSSGAKNKRELYPILCLGAHIDPGELVVTNERRIFSTELFADDAKKYSLSSREFVLRGLNSSAFLNYFFLIEDILKTIYIESLKSRNTFIKGSETISICLNEIISKNNIKSSFENELKARSQLFFDFKSLGLMWDILNLIRNQMAHANGFYDEKAKNHIGVELLIFSNILMKNLII